jgi:hypothetical protein
VGQQAHLAHAGNVLGVDLAEALDEFLGRDQFRLLGLEGSGDRAAQAEQALGQPVGAAEQALDRGQVEAVGLEVEDQAQAGDVLGVVIADPRAHLGRRKQAPRVVVADVAHRHPDLGGELLDCEVVGADGHRRRVLLRARSLGPCRLGLHAYHLDLRLPCLMFPRLR